MDNMKRFQQREQVRKASLRDGRHISYSQLGEASDSPDLSSNDTEFERRSHEATPRFTSTARPSPRLSLDTRIAPGTSEPRRFSWLSPTQKSPGTGSLRQHSPLSPGRGSSRQVEEAPQVRQDDSPARSSARSRPSVDGIRLDVRKRGAASSIQEDDDEGKRLPQGQLPTYELEDVRERNVGKVRTKKEKWHVRSQRHLRENTMAVINFILRRKATVASGSGREVTVDVHRKTPALDVRTGSQYVRNSIRTSKYSYYSFVPRQLLFQFSKFANIYFLCISILQMIPGLSTTGSYTTIIPLMVFVMVSMAKEGMEDLRRHKMDKSENRATVVRAKGGDWETTKWEQLQVGDVVKLKRDENVPADLVLINVQGSEDMAYVETMALDGETNLKNKGAPALLQKLHLSPEETLARNDISVQVEEPNLDLYNFSGNVKLGSEMQPLSNEQVLYRGSILRNTNLILGLVIYTGEECKIRMNANKSPRIKSPRMQNVVNKVVLFIVALVVFLALLLSVFYLTSERWERRAFYLKDATVSIVPVFVSFIIMLNTMIPLSLYVSMEIVKLVQITLMMSDIEMYDPTTKTPMEAKTSTINEELGQISYVFSDKTGTLTDNVMKFRKISVAGAAWLHNPEAEDEDYTEYPVKDRDYKRVSRPSLEGTPLTGNTEDLLRMMLENPATKFAKRARVFLLSIALCHTCVSEPVDGNFDYSATSPDEVALVQAAQEMGYIFVDRKAGVVTIRAPSLTGASVEEQYHVLEVLEFSSKRKRMSLVVRMPDGRVCVFCKGADSIIKDLLRQTELTKKSEAKVERKATLRKSIEAQDYMRRKSVQQARHNFARASKQLARESIVDDSENLPPMSPMTPLKMDFNRRANTIDLALKRKSWHSIEPSVTSPSAMSPRSPYNMSSTQPVRPGMLHQRLDSIESVDGEALPVNEEAEIFEKCFQHIDYFATEGLRTLLYGYRYVDENEYKRWGKLYHEASTSLTDRQLKIEKAAALIERGLELAGATAIEDKLQHGVPLTIDRLRRAGIKVWVLTGDKRETAMNIGKSCQLIKDFSTIAVLDHTQGDIFLQIQAALTEMRNAVHSVVVVDGQTLVMIEEDEPLFDFFHALAVFVDSVLCCRASPAQKASLVRSIRTRVPDSVTLAIGDGSNDVAMIQEAHVGIGIAGREGLQAARSSDYSIAQFRFLARLLLVHGRWNYVRICKYTLCTFWKEMMFFLTQAMFQKYNGYTGTSLYESWSLSMFNTLFTSLPVIFIGIFEKDLSAETLIAVPELYNYGQRARGFSLSIYFAWAAMSSAYASLVFYLPMTLYGQAPYHRDSQLYSFGALAYTAAVIVINFKIQFWEIHNKTIFAAGAILLETVGWFMWLVILSLFYADNTTYHVKNAFVHQFGRDGLWWLVLVLTVAMCWALELGVKMTRVVLYPNDVDVHQKLEKDPAIWERIQITAHAGEEDASAGMSQVAPPRRTATQQLRRDAEYEALLTRTRSATVSSRGSVEGIRKIPGKLVRFLTRDEVVDETSGSVRPGTSSTMTPGAFAPTGPTWNRGGTTQQDIEMANMDFATPRWGATE